MLLTTDVLYLGQRHRKKAVTASLIFYCETQITRFGRLHFAIWTVQYGAYMSFISLIPVMIRRIKYSSCKSTDGCFVDLGFDGLYHFLLLYRTQTISNGFKLPCRQEGCSNIYRKLTTTKETVAHQPLNMYKQNLYLCKS